MGLGLHGGGLESVRYLLDSGAKVTCTDLRSEEELKPSLAALAGKDVRFVLGRHSREDFDDADIIVKNPAVPADSHWIKGRKNIETDISLFLKASDSPILAVTGSKGKSTVVTALHHILKQVHPGTRLGGNIAVSPLSFLQELKSEDPVVLELSSWQLADLRGRGVLRPSIACITNLMHDHQNRYDRFEDYEADKAVIFENLDPGSRAVFPDDAYGRKWAADVGKQAVLIGADDGGSAGGVGVQLDEKGRGWFIEGNTRELILPETLRVPGEPFRINMLFASTMARLWGCKPAQVVGAQRSFTGVPYRMELFMKRRGLSFYDDTAATIPDATAAAVLAINGPVILIAGGTDKELDFSPLDAIAGIPKRVILLKGTATDSMIPRMKSAGTVIEGPFDDMGNAVEAAVRAAEPGDAVLLSPGAASFGMFRHEFERGDAFKEACRRSISLKN